MTGADSSTQRYRPPARAYRVLRRTVAPHLACSYLPQTWVNPRKVTRYHPSPEVIIGRLLRKSTTAAYGMECGPYGKGACQDVETFGIEEVLERHHGISAKRTRAHSLETWRTPTQPFIRRGARRCSRGKVRSHRLWEPSVAWCRRPLPRLLLSATINHPSNHTIRDSLVEKALKRECGSNRNIFDVDIQHHRSLCLMQAALTSAR